MRVWDKFSKKLNWLLGAEGLARFLVLVPLLRTGNWGKAGLGMLVIFCIIWCGLTVLLERQLWEEARFYERWSEAGGEGVVMVLYAGLLHFFTAQISVFLRLGFQMAVQIWNMLRGGADVWGAFLILPFLAAAVVSSAFYLRKICARLWCGILDRYAVLSMAWRERKRPSWQVSGRVGFGTGYSQEKGSTESGNVYWKEQDADGSEFGKLRFTERIAGILARKDFLWWWASLLAAALAVGYRDAYSTAGFYLAYNWQLLLTFFLLFCGFCIFRKKYGKRDCRE